MGEFKIVIQGKPGANIFWFGTDGDQTAPLAAKELSLYLQKCSGVLLPIKRVSRQLVTDSDSGPWKSGILLMKASLGVNQHPIHLRPSAETLHNMNNWISSAKDDSLMICADEDKIILAGQNQRGTLYAVYRFLEHLGVRFFAPNFVFYNGNAEWCPQLDVVELDTDQMPIVEEPDFKYRRKYVEEGWSHTPANLLQLVDWMAKKRLNTLVYPMNYQGLDIVRWEEWREFLIPHLQARDLLIEVGGHGFESFLPPEVYQDKHPEWFPEPEEPAVGLRDRNANVFHFATEPALRTYINNVIAYLKDHPEISIFDAWPPDSCAWPASDVERFNTIENSNAYIINELRKSMEIELPHVKIETISYVPTTNPPTSECMYASSVLADFALYDRSYRYGISDDACLKNHFYNHLFGTWRKSGFSGDICVYEYYTKYSWHSLPVTLPQLLFEEIPHYHALSVDGLGIYSEPANWLTYEITHLIAADLSWNCKTDKDRYLTEYFHLRFGSAANEMALYFDSIEKAGRLIFDKPEGDYSDESLIKQALEYYGKANQNIALAKKLLMQEEDKRIDIVNKLGLNLLLAIEITKMQLSKLTGQQDDVDDAQRHIRRMVNQQRFSGTVLESMHLIRKYDPSLPRGKEGIRASRWAYDHYRKEWK